MLNFDPVKTISISLGMVLLGLVSLFFFLGGGGGGVDCPMRQYFSLLSLSNHLPGKWIQYRGRIDARI